jgi:hypothetical protein
MQQIGHKHTLSSKACCLQRDVNHSCKHGDNCSARVTPGWRCQHTLTPGLIAGACTPAGCLHTHLHACLPAWLSFCLAVCLSVCLSACWLGRLPAGWAACLLPIDPTETAAHAISLKNSVTYKHTCACRASVKWPTLLLRCRTHSAGVAKLAGLACLQVTPWREEACWADGAWGIWGGTTCKGNQLHNGSEVCMFVQGPCRL